MLHITRRGLAAFVVGMLALPQLEQCFAASPELQFTIPRGAQRGTDARITIQGNRIADAKELLFYIPGVTATDLKAVDPQHVTATVHVAKDAHIGQYPIRLRTASGISELRTFYVTPFPVVMEKEPNNDEAHAQPIELNTTVNGTIENEDVDTFVVDAKRGQHITAEVVGMRLGDAMFDPYVEILDSRRFALVAVDDTAFGRQDPVASTVIPADGKYFVKVRDTSYTGGGNFHYLLSVGTFPRPATVFPLGGQAGKETEFRFIGDSTGDLTTKLTLPNEAVGDFDLTAERDGLLSPTPNTIRISPFPNTMEVEPNHDLAHATPAAGELPVALNGIISKPGEIDFFKFTAHKGQVLDVRVYARSQRSPLDSVIAVFNDKGQQLIANDDSGGPDSYLRFNAVSDGWYTVEIFDQLHHGGPDFTYRIEVMPVKPTLMLQIPQYALFSQERNWVSIPRGNKFATLIRGTRADFGGALKLSCPNLPPGVTMHCDEMAANLDVTPVVFEAAADAPLGAALSDLTAHPTDPKLDITGQYAQPADLVIGPNNATMYTVIAPKLAVAVGEESAVHLKIIPPPVPIVQGGQMNLKVVADRGSYKGPISVRMLFNPPGVGSSPAVDIPPDKTEIDYPISAADNAEPRSWKICVLGVFDHNGPEWISSDLVDLKVAEPFVRMKLAMAATEQGHPCNVVCALEQLAPFDGAAKVQLLGLPVGATAPDATLTSADKQLVFSVTTDAKTPVGQNGTLFCQLTIMKDGNPIIHNLGRGGTLRIDAPPAPKKGEAPKPQVAIAAPPTAKPLSRLEKLRLEAEPKN